MAKPFDRAVNGFNHNISHAGRVFHVQTEDSGVNNPNIITHLFVGGNILASKKTSYSELLKAENLQELVRQLMEDQHKQMLRNVVTGAYEHTLHTQAKGQDIRAVMELGRFPGIVLAVGKDRPFKSHADLKGMKIGVTAPNSSSHFFVL